ncbi:acetyltransferase [Salinibacter ruber]|uniref:Pilin glycosylation protein PglB n=1 Tax=Salinibacter ruber (strain DSM 13855 / M31) TaxID=309807 RepID=Q2S4Y2_SALRD|nr:acetyltransferase [Salinibacter ruber]ABC44017.1 pilin glycosylation protein PglB [Salinibacter ruber DSM 13855]
MSDCSFIIVGGGGHARVVASTLRRLGETILGFTDPDEEATLGDGIEHLGRDKILTEKDPSKVALTMGMGSVRDTGHRAGLFTEQVENGFRFPTLIHPDAVLASEAKTKAGVQVMAGGVIQPGASLGENVIVNTNASVDHDCQIGAHSHVASGATLSGEVVLESQVHVGTGASIIQGVDVGKNSVVGAGAVVIEDVPPETVVIGVPAHPK